MKNQQKAYIYSILAVLCWSTAATSFKISLKYMNHVSLLLISSITSLIIFFSILLINGRINKIFNNTAKETVFSAVLGFINPFLYYVILFKAYSILPASEAQPLNWIWPVILIILSAIILKQKIGLRQIIAILFGFSGVWIISTHGNIFGLNFSNPFGVSLALGSAVFWAFFWILNVKDKRDPVVKLFLNFIFGTFYILIYFLIFSIPDSIPPLKGIAAAAYAGAFEMGITFYLWLKALELSESSAKIGNLIYLSPFISFIFLNIFIGEKILVSSVIGLIFVVSGIVIQNLRK